MNDEHHEYSTKRTHRPDEEPESQSSRIAASLDAHRVVQQTPDAERLVDRKGHQFLKTWWPDGDRPAPKETAKSRYGLKQGTMFEEYLLVCDVSRTSDGTLWLVKEANIEVEGPTLILRIDDGSELSTSERARLGQEAIRLAHLRPKLCSRVITSGETDEGLIFRVEEYVRGQPITSFSDEHHYTIGQRIELFVDLCSIIEQLHEKAIRGIELSATNVLVACDDGSPTTRLADLRCTPPNEPPRSEAEDLAADLRSLAAVLLELLVGLPATACRAVVNADTPPDPSLLLSRQCFAIPGIARNRSDEPARIIDAVTGTLDAAFRKACLPPSAGGYTELSEFTKDLRRYLRPPIDLEDSWVQKLVKKHLTD